MKLDRLLVLLILIVWISAGLTYALYKGYYKETVISEFDMDITVVEQGIVGLNVDRDAIHFGVVTWGGDSGRHINLTNSGNYDVFVYAEKDDSELSSLVTISPNYFTLKGNGNRRVDINVHVPEGFEPGNYTGKLTFIKKVAFYRR